MQSLRDRIKSELLRRESLLADYLLFDPGAHGITAFDR